MCSLFFRRLLVAGSFVALLCGCPSNSLTDEPIPSGACSDRGYSNATYGFGFNPPSGYTGPLFSTGSAYTSLPVLSASFSLPLSASRRIDVEVLAFNADLAAWVSTLKIQRLLAGNALITSEEFVTDGGAPATLLVWSSTNGSTYEAFAKSGDNIIALRGQATLLDSVFVDAPIRESLRSLCVLAPAASE